MTTRLGQANVETIPSGVAGPRVTLGRMKQLVNQSLTDPVVIQAARSVVALEMPRDKDSHARAVKAYLVDHFQFIPDPRGVEALATPRIMLDRLRTGYFVQGDCDEAAILGAAMGKAIGLRAVFVALGFIPRAPLSHVYTILRGATGWLSLDVTKPQRPLPAAVQQFCMEV